MSYADRLVLTLLTKGDYLALHQEKGPNLIIEKLAGYSLSRSKNNQLSNIVKEYGGGALLITFAIVSTRRP
jgi:hypothetical protein